MFKNSIAFLMTLLLAANAVAMSSHYEDDYNEYDRDTYTHKGKGVSQFDVISFEDKALSKMRVGHFNSAIAEFKKVLKHDSGRIKTLNGIGFCYAMLGNPNAASGFFARSMYAAGNDPLMYNEISLYMAAVGDMRDAIHLIEKIYTNSHSVVFKEELASNLAFLLAASGDSARAISIAEKHITPVKMKMAEPYFQKLEESPEFAQDEIFSRLAIKDNVKKVKVNLSLKGAIDGLKVNDPAKRKVKHKSKDAYNDLW